MYRFECKCIYVYSGMCISIYSKEVYSNTFLFQFCYTLCKILFLIFLK